MYSMVTTYILWLPWLQRTYCGYHGYSIHAVWLPWLQQTYCGYRGYNSHTVVTMVITDILWLPRLQHTYCLVTMQFSSVMSVLVPAEKDVRIEMYGIDCYRWILSLINCMQQWACTNSYILYVHVQYMYVHSGLRECGSIYIICRDGPRSGAAPVWIHSIWYQIL